MGVPKFFRWISERYPMINQTIDFENAGPVFDNLYLDCNGIIHNCTHSEKDDLHALANRTETEMFSKIFLYIDNLFNIVKPRKLFYIAIDGVAPRAKMNQQRSRRFRSAKDAEEQMKKLLERGEKPPELKPFDSNCITPGTEFMARLSLQLKYYIRSKIASDSAWKNIDVIFSGHEVPGEGEHKIMEHIRHMKAQSDWHPNQTHCLYGLDADLIMLSLVSHEPHFALLREEGILDRRKQHQKGDKQEFHLLHISLVREYLGLDFTSLMGKLRFPYDVERIIDDWVLLCFFVGNDFVPNLPGLDIGEGTLNELMNLYKKILPELDGYLMENGRPNLRNLEIVFRQLGDWERQFFSIVPEGIDKVQKKVFKSHSGASKHQADLANVLYGGGLGMSSDSIGSLPSDTEDDEAWRLQYYISKFGVAANESNFIDSITRSYIEALDWIAQYYYHGCVSWGWYYPYHYTPLAVDLRNCSRFDISFARGQPFRPLEQLLGVLPLGSRHLLPSPYRHLMLDDRSPLKKYYPDEFAIDMNGKKNDWEGIVLIPFIDETVLLEAVGGIDESKELSPEERKRNEFGQSEVFKHDATNHEHVVSPMPGVFPDIEDAQSSIKAVVYSPLKDGVTPFRLLKQTVLGIGCPAGVPTFDTIEFRAKLVNIHVNVFGSSSRKESMLLHVTSPNVEIALNAVAYAFLGKSIWVWPHNREVFVVGVSNGKEEINLKRQSRYLSREEQGLWLASVNRTHHEYRSTKAVDIGETQITLVTRSVLGVSRLSNGQLKKRFNDTVAEIPLLLAIDKRPTMPDPRFDVHKPLSAVPARFPLGSLAISMDPRHFGAVVRVKSHDSRNARVLVEIKTEPKTPSFLPSLIEKHINEKYYSPRDVCRMVGISNPVLSKISSSCQFEPGKVNLGLNIKFSKKNLQVVGFTRRAQFGPDRFGPWEYSAKAVQALQEYKAAYPTVFEVIEAEPNRRDPYHLDDVFPPLDDVIEVPEDELRKLLKSNGAESDEDEEEEMASASDEDDLSEPSEGSESENGDEELKRRRPKRNGNGEKGGKVAKISTESHEETAAERKARVNKRVIELKKWLNIIRALPCTTMPRVPCGGDALAPVMLEEYERKLSEWLKEEDERESQMLEETREALLHAMHLIQPVRDFEAFTLEDFSHGPFRYSHFAVGDRVVCLRDSGAASLGAVGSVVGLRGNFAEVLFDVPSVGGITIRGLTLPFLSRAQVLSKGALLNITSKDGVKQQQNQRGRFNERAERGGRSNSARGGREPREPRYDEADGRQQLRQTLPASKPALEKKPVQVALSDQGAGKQRTEPTSSKPITTPVRLTPDQLFAQAGAVNAGAPSVAPRSAASRQQQEQQFMQSLMRNAHPASAPRMPPAPHANAHPPNATNLSVLEAAWQSAPVAPGVIPPSLPSIFLAPPTAPQSFAVPQGPIPTYVPFDPRLRGNMMPYAPPTAGPYPAPVLRVPPGQGFALPAQPRLPSVIADPDGRRVITCSQCGSVMKVNKNASKRQVMLAKKGAPAKCNECVTVPGSAQAYEMSAPSVPVREPRVPHESPHSDRSRPQQRHEGRGGGRGGTHYAFQPKE